MRKLVLIFTMLCLASVALAQRFVSYKQYVTFNAGIGMNGYVSKLSDQGTNDVNGGFMARLGYHYVRRACGVFGGLMLQSYNTNTKLNFMQEIEGAIDQDNMPYIHRTYFHGLEENQRQLSLSIPVEFVYRIYLFGGMRLMLGVGPMFQLSMKNSYRITSGEIETRLYYPEWDLEVFGDHPEHNLYSKTGFNGNYSLRGVPGAVFDASIIYSMEKSFDLNFGFYGAYSFSPQVTNHDLNVFDPDCQGGGYNELKYNGVFNSGVAKKMNPFSIGIMVGLYYYIKSGN